MWWILTWTTAPRVKVWRPTDWAQRTSGPPPKEEDNRSTDYCTKQCRRVILPLDRPWLLLEEILTWVTLMVVPHRDSRMQIPLQTQRFHIASGDSVVKFDLRRTSMQTLLTRCWYVSLNVKKELPCRSPG